MKHHELIALQESVLDMDIGELQNEVYRKLEQYQTIKKTYTENDEKLREFLYRLEFELAALTDTVNKISGLTTLYSWKLTEQIGEGSKQRIEAENVHCADQVNRFKTAEFIRKFHKLEMTEATTDLIINRIRYYSDWRYPVLEISPKDGEWTKQLTGFYPLYIVDYNDEFLDLTYNRFNSEFQKRLRCYNNMGEGLHMLPQNQFGMVFSWNTFNYLSLNQIESYLQEIRDVLRPGGVCMLSYNNASRVEAARRSDNDYSTHIPQHELMKLLDWFGFVDIQTHNEDLLVSWVEFKKPGDLVFKRGGQALGKIINAPAIKP